MLQVKTRSDGRLILMAIVAAVLFLCLAVAPSAMAQEGDEGEGSAEQDGPASWLWQWRDPYHPETLLLAGGDDLFRRGWGRLRVRDVAQEDVSLDLSTASVRRLTLYGGRDAAAPVPMTIDQYRVQLTGRSLRTQWVTYSKRGLAKAASQAAPIGTLKLELPVAVPKTIQKIIGRGKPNLRVSGSETITISGRSTWQVGQKANEAGRQSKFPQLNLKQDLAVNVSGEIGDKINVDIDQNSKESLANRIRINYRGYEDEILQSLDLGNTNLSLPGAQFVSYNGRHQGLFGVKANARLGDIDMTVIASKQEGQTGSNRFVGNSTVRTTNISDVSYSARTFYFLGDPREWPFDVDLTSLEVFVDDRNSANNLTQDTPPVPGKAYVWTADYPVTPPPVGAPGAVVSRTDDYVAGDFDRLIPGEDYQIVFFYEGCPTIWLNSSLAEKEVLAVAYAHSDSTLIGNTADVDTLELRLLKVSSVDLGTINEPGMEGFYDPASPFYPTVRYEMKNIYNLGSSEILPEGFSLDVFPKSGSEFNNDLNGTPYTQLLGLDRLDQNGLSALNGGGADGEIDVEQGSVFLNLGLLVFPDLRPFAPDEVDTLFWRPLFFPEGACRGGGGECEEPHYSPLTGDDAVPEIYDRKNVRISQDTKYNMVVGYRSSLYGETIFLKGNILEGSETVIANGQRLERGRDYNIDYDTGAVTLISDVARQSAADITIDYSFKPLFALGQRTLLGFSTSYNPVEDYALSTTWIYESKGATERRPKLGEEPSRTIIGDVSGSMRKTPEIFTRLIDRLPLVSTDSPSSLNLAGEIGMSFPNPNTKNHGYVEDFEGSRDDFNVDLSRMRWFYSSVPSGAPPGGFPKGAIKWYNPREERRVRADDLQPELTSVEADDSVESVEIDFDPRNGGSQSWAGLTQAVSVAGADFSQKQYLDLWVNDEFTDEEGSQSFFRDLALNPDSATIYIDVGTVSEDAMWDMTAAPNVILDTEDTGDGQLDKSDFLNEDTGLDGELSPAESGPSQTGVERADDPDGDDYDLDPDLSDISWTKFERINGTEDNDRLDTEDLNRDGILGLREAYYEYKINLADPDFKFLLTEVEEAGLPTGWRRYRIPIRGAAADTVGSPSLDSVEHVRIWLAGFSTRSRIQIARMAFTGNRWTAQGVLDSTGVEITEQELDSRGEEFLVGVVNNKEDENYSPPFDPGEDGNIERREQSLLLTYRNLEPGHTGLAFRAFDPAKDFTLYRQLKFYVRGGADLPDVGFFVRFGDEKRYYQVEMPVAEGWQEVVVDLQDLTSLKSYGAADTSVAVGDETYSVVGEPRFNQVRRVTVGLVNRGELPESGEIWFNDIRLGEVRRDIGIASRLNVQMALADFMNISGSFNGQDEDFLAIGQNRGSGIDRRRMSLGGKINAHKLVAPLHVTLPLSFNWSQNTSVPEFRTGDDRELLKEQIGQERTIARNTSFSADLARSPSRNPWLRYTVDAMRASVQWRKNRSVSPVRADTTEVVTTRLRYDLSPPQKSVRLIPGLELGYLPSNISASITTTSETRSSFDKDAGVRTKNVTLKPANMKFDVGYRPVSSLAANFSIRSSRDLLRKRPLDFLGGINIGAELSRDESVRANYSPRVFWWLGAPSFNYSGIYKENHNPGLTTQADRDSSETRRNVNNSRNYRTGLNVPWSRFMGILSSVGGDSVSAASPVAWTRALFGALGQFNQITLARTVSDRSSYNGIYGVPDLSYKLGLSRDLGRDSRAAPSGSSVLSTSEKTDARTDGALFKDYRVSVAYSREDRDTENTAGTTYNRMISWPDLKVDVAGLETKLNLEGRLTRLTAQSAYSGQSSKSLAQGGKQKSLSKTKNWRPLASVNATWKGGLNTTFSANRRTEERTTFNAAIAQVRRVTNASYSLNLQKTIKGGESVSLPFAKGRKTRKTINFTLNVSYNSNRSERELSNGRVQVDSDNDKFRALSRATYNFSSNMVGTFELSFDQTRNKKVRRTIRGVGVNASVRLRF